MLIDFNETKEITIPGMNGGTGTMSARMFMDAAVDEHVKEGELSVIDIEGMDISHDIMFIYRKKSIYEKMYVKIYEEMRDNPHITTA